MEPSGLVFKRPWPEAETRRELRGVGTHVPPERDRTAHRSREGSAQTAGPDPAPGALAEARPG